MRSITVIAEPLVAESDLTEFDQEIPGKYVVEVSESVTDNKQAASIALDMFHQSTSVESPEQFNFTVLDEGGNELLEDPDHDNYSLCHLGGEVVQIDGWDWGSAA